MYVGGISALSEQNYDAALRACLLTPVTASYRNLVRPLPSGDPLDHLCCE